MSEYKRIFSKEAFGKLSKSSAESLQSMLKGKSFMQAAEESMRLLKQLQEAEAPHREHLETLALMVIEEMFPIVEEAGIEIDAKLVDSSGEMKLGNPPETEEEEEEEIPELQVDKRRIINAITQGAAIRGSKSFYMFKDILDALDESLFQAYEDVVNAAYGIYDDDNAIAMMLAMIAQGGASQGGESDMEYDEETGTLTVKARALIFPILLQEIIKGIYEIVSLQGFSGDKEVNQRIVDKVDKTTNEPEDIRYGKFIFDALANLTSDIKRPAIRELFFAEVYKLPDEEFKLFIDNLLAGKVGKDQQNWIKQTLERLHRNES